MPSISIRPSPKIASELASYRTVIPKKETSKQKARREALDEEYKQIARSGGYTVREPSSKTSNESSQKTSLSPSSAGSSPLNSFQQKQLEQASQGQKDVMKLSASKASSSSEKFNGTMRGVPVIRESEKKAFAEAGQPAWTLEPSSDFQEGLRQGEYSSIIRSPLIKTSASYVQTSAQIKQVKDVYKAERTLGWDIASQRTKFKENPESFAGQSGYLKTVKTELIGDQEVTTTDYSLGSDYFKQLPSYKNYENLAGQTSLQSKYIKEARQDFDALPWTTRGQLEGRQFGVTALKYGIGFAEAGINIPRLMLSGGTYIKTDKGIENTYKPLKMEMFGGSFGRAVSSVKAVPLTKPTTVGFVESPKQWLKEKASDPSAWVSYGVPTIAVASFITGGASIYAGERATGASRTLAFGQALTESAGIFSPLRIKQGILGVQIKEYSPVTSFRNSPSFKVADISLGKVSGQRYSVGGEAKYTQMKELSYLTYKTNILGGTRLDITTLQLPSSQSINVLSAKSLADVYDVGQGNYKYYTSGARKVSNQWYEPVQTTRFDFGKTLKRNTYTESFKGSGEISAVKLTNIKFSGEYFGSKTFSANIVSKITQKLVTPEGITSTGKVMTGQTINFGKITTGSKSFVSTKNNIYRSYGDITFSGKSGARTITGEGVGYELTRFTGKKSSVSIGEGTATDYIGNYKVASDFKSIALTPSKVAKISMGGGSSEGFGFKIIKTPSQLIQQTKFQSIVQQIDLKSSSLGNMPSFAKPIVRGLKTSLVLITTTISGTQSLTRLSSAFATPSLSTTLTSASLMITSPRTTSYSVPALTYPVITSLITTPIVTAPTIFTPGTGSGYGFGDSFTSFTVPTLPLLWGADVGGLIKRRVGGRRAKGYIPSFKALVFGIKGRKPKGIETGLRIRPITKGFSFGKIKLKF